MSDEYDLGPAGSKGYGEYADLDGGAKEQNKSFFTIERKVAISKGLQTCGGIILVLMALCIGGAFAMHFGITSALKEGVYDAKVILPQSSAFLEWCCPQSVNVTKEAKKVQYDSVSMFNLTNPGDVLKGKKPIYEQLPLIRYRRYTEREDITFGKDNNTVSFRDRTVYVYEPDEDTKIDPKTTRITNINPAYLAVIQKAQDENVLMFGMGLGLVQQTFMEKLFYIEFAVYMNLLHRKSILQADIQAAITSAGSQAAFCNVFSNATAPNGDAIWDKMIPDSANGMTEETCEALFDENTGLLVEPKDLITWMKAIAHQDEASIMKVAEAVNATTTTMNIIHQWLVGYDMENIFPENVNVAMTQVKDKMTVGSIDNYQQYGMLQWTSGMAIPGEPGKSIKDIIPEAVQYQPELAIVNGQSDNFIPLSSVITLATTNFFDQDNYQEFMTLISNGNFNEIQIRYGLTESTAQAVFLYVAAMANNIKADFPSQFIDKGLAFITTKTIHEWVMDYNDPLLSLLGEGAKARELLVLKNETWTEAKARRQPSSIFTGNDNIDRVTDYASWNGSEWLTLWNERVRILGTDGEQFHSNMQLNDDVFIWFPDVLRPQNFSAMREVYHEDIRMLRIMLKPNMSLPTPIFHNNFSAIANMTILGAPMYVSKWYLCQAESYLRDAITVLGIKDGDLEKENCDTIIDVEPISGMSMFERKRVQINVYIDESLKKGLSLFQPLLKANVMFPIARVLESAEISSEQASVFRSQVSTLVTIQTVLYWVLIGVGLFFFVLGGVTLIVGCAISSRVKKQKLAANQS